MYYIEYLTASVIVRLMSPSDFYTGYFFLATGGQVSGQWLALSAPLHPFPHHHVIFVNSRIMTFAYSAAKDMVNIMWQQNGEYHV